MKRTPDRVGGSQSQPAQVLGYADDAIIVTAVLRGVVRRAGIDAVRGHWPGTDDGFTALVRLTGLAHQPDHPTKPRGTVTRRTQSRSDG